MTFLRGKIGGLVAFLAIAALVAGGLGWVTCEVLSLEAERRLAASARERESLQKEQDERYAEKVRQVQVERAEKMRLALALLDSRLTPALAREDSRPYPQYLALYSPFPAVTHTGLECAPGQFYLPSPLLTAELPEWMLLHFQVDAAKGWTSPQVIPEETQRMLRRQPIELALNNVDDLHKQRLNDLKAAYPTRSFLDTLRAHGFSIDENGQQDQSANGLINNGTFSQNFKTQVGQNTARDANDKTEQGRRNLNLSQAMNEGIWAYLNDGRNYIPLDHNAASKVVEAKQVELRAIEKQLRAAPDAANKQELQTKFDSLRKEVEELKKIAQQPVEVELGR